MLATPARTVPQGDGWVLEPKWDGFRGLAHVNETGVRLYTRRGRAHHDRFPRLNEELRALPAGTVLDGELVCLERIEGTRVHCRFDRLSAFMVGRSPHRPSKGLTVTFVAFDALAIAGKDQRPRPWEERRQELERLLAGANGTLRLTPVLRSDQAIHDALIADGWEGTVAKRQAGRYACGRRSSAWVKIKSPAARDRDRRRIAAS
jgi:bifunctional non-homologous end joining protein LigD